LSASLPEAVVRFLRAAGLAGTHDPLAFEILSGGVSSDIWRVGAVCVKRALPRLRVAQLWEAPVERNRYERLWMETAGAAAPGAAPRVLAHDDAAGLFAMEFVDLPLWKNLLRQGTADAAFAGQVGARLAAIHAGTAAREEIAARFPTDAIFHAIRLEPYLLATAAKHRDLHGILASMVEGTIRRKICLVHGDVSPKNILVGARGPVFLDAECAWYGDPAFDLAFCLNHLLLKCLWVPEHAPAYLACFEALHSRYLPGVNWEERQALEARTAALLPGLMLARVDGKSPVEYITRDAQKEQVRVFSRRFLLDPCESLRRLSEAWRASLR
jgi:aminoglycoside phosphotransferase (APT) family kinase protein